MKTRIQGGRVVTSRIYVIFCCTWFAFLTVLTAGCIGTVEDPSAALQQWLTSDEDISDDLGNAPPGDLLLFDDDTFVDDGSGETSDASDASDASADAPGNPDKPGPGPGVADVDGSYTEEDPIECCDCRDECPPVNCPCLDSAKVNVISVYIKKFRPRGRDNEPGSPWVKLTIDPGVYDLMDLKHDLFAGVNARAIPPGHYSMIRLTLQGEEIIFCDNPTAYPFYVAQENKNKIEIKKGIKLFETFYICEGKHTKVELKFPEDGLLTWIKAGTLVRLHPKIWVESVSYLPIK